MTNLVLRPNMSPQMHDYGKGLFLTQHKLSSRNYALLQLWMEFCFDNFGWDENRKWMETDTASHLSIIPPALLEVFLYKINWHNN